MTPSTNAKTIIFFLFIILSCGTNKIHNSTIDELNSKEYLKIPLEELLQNKGRYHGKFIETAGTFNCGFEVSAIYNYVKVSLGDTIVNYKDHHNGLWIDFNVHHPFYYSCPDSLRNQFVYVKGFFDTTKTGHMGDYKASLTDTYYLKTIDKD